MIIVTSWDDGYPADMRMADLLNRHGLTGTFFVPIENSEGRPVLNKADLRELGSRFEIGSHTYNHIRLEGLENGRVDEEIRGGKMGLEEILGHSVDGFCYPLGYVTPYAVNSLRKNGVRYARTITNFHLDAECDRYHVPTTFQVFSHAKQVYLRNFIKRGQFRKRWSCFQRTMMNNSLWGTLDSIAEDCNEQDGVLHLWGHTWEIEEYDLWQELDAYFSRLKQFAPTPKTVGQSIDHLLSNERFSENCSI